MDLDELEKLARAATPGPWVAGKYGISGDEDATTPVVSWDYAWGDCANESDDKPYIAAASPDVLLALIARVRAAEAAADESLAYPRALQAAADVAFRMADMRAKAGLSHSSCVRIAGDILELRADDIDSFAKRQEQAHLAGSGER